MWCVGDPQGTQLRACSTREEGQAATPLGGPQALTRPPLSVLPYAQSILATDSSLDCSVLPHPWDSPGKNTGVGCHSLLQCVKVKSLSRVADS